ncbi:hypothetical protein [Luteimonas arsenica]|uniref:hypothetical protein n=1 Tax=Luteimonas arsenica TaxID=1586242 RepID=UPI0010566652|nr:hypothetical protein [Luteimonas arsenica]
MRHRLPLLLAATAIILLAAGCQKAADAATEAAIERASGQKVQLDRDGNRLRISAGSGADEVSVVTGEGIALPADFPDDLFLPADYGVSSVMDVGGARLLNLQSRGAVATVFEDARTAMQDKGWSQTMAMQQADSAMLGFSRDGREAAYTFTRHGDEQLMIGIQLREQAQRQ